MIKVILKRGKKDTRQWEHEDLRSAMQRAFALAELHSARISTSRVKELVVDASHYYGEKR